MPDTQLNSDQSTNEDLWVFRDGRNPVAGTVLLHDLQLSLRSVLEDAKNKNYALKALIQSGEFESALADVENPGACLIAELTSALAVLYLDGDTTVISKLAGALDSLTVPNMLVISPPEGFSYYALHPLDFVRAVEEIADSSRPAAVIGIRSIGTTLSAVVTAALKKRFVPAQRITVRPTGHPYDRITRFSSEQILWINQWKERSAKFLVVDEGPGRSGSTFISVGEALVQAGISPANVTLIGSVEPDLNELRARDAVHRWKTFRFLKCMPTSCSRFSNHIYIGGGEWRRELLRNPGDWPACWPQMERLKFLSPDGADFFKFEGLGKFGEAVQQRGKSLADEGFGYPLEEAGDGFTFSKALPGQSLRTNDISIEILERIARYCAFRASEFRCTNGMPNLLPEMVRLNVQQEFGVELDAQVEALALGDSVLCDGRMQSHEWIRNEKGILLKTDGTTHGDDHFFPGPCDIAWDLAGTSVEWDLPPDALEFLLLRFRELSGINVAGRISIFILAYAVFRMAFCKMAAGTVRGTADEFRLRKAALYYRRRVERHLFSKTVGHVRSSRAI